MRNYLSQMLQKRMFVPLALGSFLLFSFLSISTSQLFLFVALILWLVFAFKSKPLLKAPGFFWFLLAYAGISVLSSLFSVNPGVSFADSRDLLLLVIVPVVYTGFSEKTDVDRIYPVLFASFFISAVYSYFHLIFRAEPGERITGFMGHWMTQAGLLLLFCAAALAFFLFKKEKIRFLWGGGFVLALPLMILTLTRNAWLGLVCATIVLLYLYKPKTLILLPVLVGVAFFVSPQSVRERALSTFDLRDSTNKQRIEYWNAGLKIIKSFPLVGTGPGTVSMEFQRPRYNLSEESKKNVHLHNNLLQIAAERGVFALLAWLGFVVWAFLGLVRMIRGRDPDIFPYAAAGLAALVGVFLAGFFEYNWGDSEVVTLFLFVLTVPFSLNRINSESHQQN